MDRRTAIERVRAARVGRMATVRADGSPHVVPFVFALVEDGDRVTLYWTVDDKPKRSRRLRRLENLEREPRVEVVVDGYAEEWTELWWVRVTGRGRVVSDDAERGVALEALREKYEPYAALAEDADVVAIDVDRLSAWRGSGSGAPDAT